MPKKKKVAGKAKKAKSKKVDAKAVASAGPTALEISLRMELETLDQELLTAKAEVDEARRQNEWLVSELKHTDDEILEYEAFVSKSTTREQSRIQSITERNTKEIAAIERERADRAAETEKSKTEIQKAILAKEGEYERIHRQLIALADVRMRRDDQLAEMAALEQEIEHITLEQNNALQELKARYLQEKLESHRTAHTSVKSLEQQASREAAVCLSDHSQRIKDENRQLRRELLGIITSNKSLQERESMLLKQNQELKRQSELDLTAFAHRSRLATSAHSSSRLAPAGISRTGEHPGHSLGQSHHTMKPL